MCNVSAVCVCSYLLTGISYGTIGPLDNVKLLSRYSQLNVNFNFHRLIFNGDRSQCDKQNECDLKSIGCLRCEKRNTKFQTCGWPSLCHQLHCAIIRSFGPVFPLLLPFPFTPSPLSIDRNVFCNFHRRFAHTHICSERTNERTWVRTET